MSTLERLDITPASMLTPADHTPMTLTIVTTYWDGAIERETFDTQFVLDHFAELAWYARAEGHDYVKRTGNMLRIGRYSDKWSIHVVEPVDCEIDGHRFNDLGVCEDCD
jgi:hypothetical protein